MLLGIYLGSIAASFIAASLESAAVSFRLKNKGYIYVGKRSVPERVLDLLKVALFISIPGYNTILAISLLINSEKIINNAMNDSIGDGSYILPEEIELYESSNIKSLKEKYDNLNENELYRDHFETLSNTSLIDSKEKIRILSEEKDKLLQKNSGNLKNKNLKQKNKRKTNYILK